MAQKDDVAWQVDKVFTHDETGITAIVKKLPLHRPRFSMEVCVKLEGERFARYLPGVKGWGDTDFGAIVGELVTTGQSYIAEQVSLRAEIIALEEGERAKREAEKRKRHADNVEIRREANRQAAHAQKGKGKSKS